MNDPEFYRRLIDASPVGIAFVRAGKLEFINRAGKEILGEPRSVEEIGDLDSLTSEHDWQLIRSAAGRLWARRSDFGEGTLLLFRLPGEELRAPGMGDLRHEILVERLADVVFVIDLNGKFVFLNQGFTRATGWKREDWIGRHFTEIVAPEYRDLTRERFHAGPPPDGISQYAIEILTADGGRLPVELRVTSLRDQGGREIGRIGTARDVSERRRFEEELRRRNEALDLILNTMGEGVVVLDAQHRMVNMNRKARELFGYSLPEIVGKDFTFWTPPDEVDELRRHLKDREKGKDETYIVRFIRKGGDEFYAQVTAVPIRGANGEFQGSIGCLRDVTREVELSRQVDGLSELNRRLLEIADVWINVVDADGNVLLWNREAERISGYSRDEVMNNPEIQEWLYPDPAYRAAIAQELAKTDGDQPHRFERAIRTKSGEERVLTGVWRPVRLADGRDGWLIVGHDVTAERAREERLRKYAAEVEQLSQSRTRLFSMAAHELRTPLTVVRGFIDLVQHAGGLSEQQARWLARAREETDRLGHLVTQLLEVSHLEQGEERLYPRSIQLAPIVKKVIRELTPLLADRGQSIDYTPGSPSISVYVDPHALERIMRNLLENAIHYTPPPGRVTVTAAVEDQTVRVDVTDEGMGIAPDELQAVFTEFYRTDAGKRMKRDGSGIGLAIVRRLVEQSGGRVWATSPGEGKGSTFSFTLPRGKERA